MIRLAILLLSLVSPARAESQNGALIWLPPENFRRWSEVDALLRSRPELKLTVGISPAMASPLVKAALRPWVEKGRVEIAARVNGDPVLTLIAAHPAAPRPQDAVERAVEARERLEKRLGAAPTGFLPGAGALDASMAAALGGGGADWILAGPYAPADAPWAATGKSVLVPSAAAQIVDETAVATSTFVTDYPSYTRPTSGWSLAGELARAKKDAPADAAAVAAWPAWNETAAQVPSEPGPKASWEAYGAAAKALDRYQNSGSADLKTLDGAVEMLRRAQAARFYRPTDSEELPAELRTALQGVYKRLKLPAPESLYGAASTNAAIASTEERPTGVKALSGPGWLEFRSPSSVLALAPAAVGASSGAAIVDGGQAADPWRLRALRAEWNDESVKLIVKVGRAFAGPPRPVYEIYIDFNHVLGAGRVPMLEGRGAVVMARDAWELALSIVGSEARLYRVRGGGEPEETGVYKTDWASDRGEATVVIPRAVLRGNPARWGWSVVALAEDPARPNRHPAASLVGPDGTILLGTLAPADAQKPILSRANARVPAARLEP